MALPLVTVLLLALSAAAGPAEPAQPAQPSIEQAWKPLRGGGPAVTAIAVRMTISGLPDSAGRRFSLDVPITYAGVAGIADRVRDLMVADPSGAVPLTPEDDPADPSGFPFFRHLRAGRPVSFPVVVTYRALAPAEPLRGPPFGLYAAYGGVSGAGAGFLVLPEFETPVLHRVHWDLSDFPAGATAASSFGVGDFSLTVPPAALRQGWIMAGPLGSYPPAGAGRFSAFWLGTPVWDPDAEMAWAGRMFRYLGDFYEYLPLPSYRVFVRVAPPGSRFNGSGTALDSSFMAGAEARAAGAPPSGEANRETFAHEMGHLFVGGIEAPPGIGSWFTEGLNTYYTRLLRMRGGFSSVADYLREVNDDFGTYYRSPARNFSADSIARIGFRDEDVRHIPYLRGSLYFAELDAQVRARSAGRRNLDILVRELFRRRAAGVRFDQAAWIDLVVGELGPAAREEFEGLILRGERTLVPASDAFGPCAERVAEPGAVGETGYRWVRKPGVDDEACRR
ncbi:MAG: hypothetical protein AB7L66_00600 [Gemmatimonadales bacterium]